MQLSEQKAKVEQEMAESKQTVAETTKKVRLWRRKRLAHAVSRRLLSPPWRQHGLLYTSAGKHRYMPGRAALPNLCAQARLARLFPHVLLLFPCSTPPTPRPT